MTVTNFFWDEFSDNLLMETDENNVPTVVYTHRPERFGQLISQKRGGVTSYYHYDGEHSTRLLTDDNQTVTDTYIYSAFGELVARTGTTTNPFGYKGAVGYYTNSATNDIYVRARTYAPVTGRWLSMDPLGFVDGPNLYRAYFVPGDIDPSGADNEGRLRCEANCRAKYFDDGGFPIFSNLSVSVRNEWFNICILKCQGFDIDDRPTSVYCGKLCITCKNGTTYTWHVLGKSSYAAKILGVRWPNASGCVTFTHPRRIECTGDCSEIKTWEAAPGVPILNHEACHACAFEEHWYGFLDYLKTAIWDNCDDYSRPAVPQW